MILLPGTFKVSDFRKAIPDWVKVVAAIKALHCPPHPTSFLIDYGELIAWVRRLRYDHRPPLSERPYDTEKGDFDPPQNDPKHIEALPSEHHDERTFGRKHDAEKIVTTAGSDAHNRKKVLSLSRKQAAHELVMAARAGDTEAMKQVVSNLEKDRRRPKQKIPSRPFPKQQRKMRRAS